MARIRSVKPEFWVSEQLAECSTNARLTFIGLWNFCDDNGVHPAKPRTLKAELYPMDDFSSGDVEGWIGELVRTGLVIEFESAGEAYWHVTGWARHQRIDRPSFKYPAPPDQNSENGGRTLADRSQTPSANLAPNRIPQTVSGESSVPAVSEAPIWTSAALGTLAQAFPLPWSAYVRLLSVKSEAARAFYETEALRCGWSVRQLDRQVVQDIACSGAMVGTPYVSAWVVGQKVAAGVAREKEVGDGGIRKYSRVRAAAFGSLVDTANARLLKLRSTLAQRYSSSSTDDLLSRVFSQPEQRGFGV